MVIGDHHDRGTLRIRAAKPAQKVYGPGIFFMEKKYIHGGKISPI